MASVIHKAPYSRLEPVLNTLRAIRTKGVPEQITSAVLAKWGIAEGNAYQVTQTLRFLGIIDDGGKPTDDLERLRRATPQEYPGVLAQLIRKSYHFIFDYFNPDEEDPSAISNAFFQVEPRGQKERMEWLFAGLCREAGILPKDDKPARVPQPKYHVSTSKTKPQSITALQTEMPTQRLEQSMLPGTYAGRQLQLPFETGVIQQISPFREARIDPRYDLLVSLIEKLPVSGEWTQSEHALWTQVWNGALKMCVRVVPDGEAAP